MLKTLEQTAVYTSQITEDIVFCLYSDWCVITAGKSSPDHLRIGRYWTFLYCVHVKAFISHRVLAACMTGLAQMSRMLNLKFVAVSKYLCWLNVLSVVSMVAGATSIFLLTFLNPVSFAVLLWGFCWTCACLRSWCWWCLWLICGPLKAASE